MMATSPAKWTRKSLHSAFEQCKSRFGIEYEAKAEQLAIVLSVLNQNDVIGVCPTGFGKSLCMVIPTMINDGESTTLIISPLTALMDDQVEKFNKLGLSAIKIETLSGQPADINDIKEAKYQVVLCSPETAIKSEWKNVFLSDVWQEKTILVVIDEAHCISEWGGDFRPEYKMLYELKCIFSCSFMALTATTTTLVKDDILKHLHLDIGHTDIIAMKPDRPNIFLHVLKKETGQSNLEALDWLLCHLKEQKEKSKKAIVYCRSVNAVADVFRSLKSELGDDAFICGIKDHDHLLVQMYHRSLTDGLKKTILENFKSSEGSIRCLVATAAIGMGIDIPDIDIVCHLGSPKSILSFWQEAGRCARDGRKGYSLVLWDSFSVSSKGTDPELAKLIKNENNVCFRQLIMDKFIGVAGQVAEGGYAPTCNNCSASDICECKLCRCCWQCIQKCPCQQKINFGLEKFIQM